MVGTDRVATNRLAFDGKTKTPEDWGPIRFAKLVAFQKINDRFPLAPNPSPPKFGDGLILVENLLVRSFRERGIK